MHAILAFTILLLPAFSDAAPRTFIDLADLAQNLLNAGIGVALSLGIVVYFYGIATGIPKANKGDTSALKAHILWGLLALFVMFSVWGILAVVRNTLFSGGADSFDSYDDDAVLCEDIDDCIID